MKRHEVFSIISFVFLCFITAGCSNHLKSQFETCYAEDTPPDKLLINSEIKRRIVESYSQQYYDKLLENADVYSPVFYDSIQNCYRLYAWKDKAYSLSGLRLRYYLLNDSLAVNLFVDEWDIDKSGDTDYNGWEEGDQDVFEKIKIKAKQGKSTAQAMLGFYYINSEVIEKDYEEALKWFYLAGKQNNSTAQYFIALREQDKDRGMYWLNKAANQGEPGAQNLLGNHLYSDGDYHKSMELFLEAAEHNTEAQYTLGCIYLEGEMVTQNKQEGIKWLVTAAENGNLEAQLYLGVIYMEDEIVSHDYVQALYWLTEVAKQGHSGIQFLLGCIYMQDKLGTFPSDIPEIVNNKITAQDVEKGLEWLIKAGEQGYVTAQRNLGAYYYREHDMEKARFWFHKAYEQGDKSCLIFQGIY